MRQRRAASQLAAEIAWQTRIVRRNRGMLLTVFVFPAIFLVLFNVLTGDRPLPGRGAVHFSQFSTPGLAALVVILSCYVNLATGIVIARDEGVLKRVRGTPLRSWIYLGGWVGASTLTALLSVVTITLVSVALFELRIAWGAVPGLLLTIVLGAACFCALGLAVTAVIPSAPAAAPVANGSIFPLVLISDIFFPLEGGPEWLRKAASWLPLKHFAAALQGQVTAEPSGVALPWEHLGVMLAWFVVGMLLALRTFRWEPPSPAERPARARRGAA